MLFFFFCHSSWLFLYIIVNCTITIVLYCIVLCSINNSNSTVDNDLIDSVTWRRAHIILSLEGAFSV